MVSVCPLPKMHMVLVDRDRLRHLLRRELGIDQQMMVSRIGLFHPGRSDTHLRAEAEDDLEWAGDDLPIVQVDEIRVGADRRRRLGGCFRLRRGGRGSRLGR